MKLRGLFSRSHGPTELTSPKTSSCTAAEVPAPRWSEVCTAAVYLTLSTAPAGAAVATSWGWGWDVCVASHASHACNSGLQRACLLRICNPGATSLSPGLFLIHSNKPRLAVTCVRHKVSRNSSIVLCLAEPPAAVERDGLLCGMVQNNHLQRQSSTGCSADMRNCWEGTRTRLGKSSAATDTAQCVVCQALQAQTMRWPLSQAPAAEAILSSCLNPCSAPRRNTK